MKAITEAHLEDLFLFLSAAGNNPNILEVMLSVLQ